jgi:hypothetical protein
MLTFHIQPAEISPAEEWQNITKQMFASILLGCPIIDVPDLYDFKHGFNMRVRSGTSFCDVGLSTCVFIHYVTYVYPTDPIDEL